MMGTFLQTSVISVVFLVSNGYAQFFKRQARTMDPFGNSVPNIFVDMFLAPSEMRASPSNPNTGMTYGVPPAPSPGDPYTGMTNSGPPAQPSPVYVPPTVLTTTLPPTTTTTKTTTTTTPPPPSGDPCSSSMMCESGCCFDRRGVLLEGAAGGEGGVMGTCEEKTMSVGSQCSATCMCPSDLKCHRIYPPSFKPPQGELPEGGPVGGPPALCQPVAFVNNRIARLVYCMADPLCGGAGGEG